MLFVRRAFAVLAGLLASFGGGVSSRLQAGIGPENVVVVARADSHSSRTVANHYLELRGIPTTNLILLEDVPDGLKISLEDFKSLILRPILAQIDKRGLAAQTSVIAYSVDFPTSVTIPEHTQRMTDPNIQKYQLPTASITGLTYFYRFLLADDANYLGWFSNLYGRGTFERHFTNPFSGEKKDEFEAAAAMSDDGKHREAAAGFEKLHAVYPTLTPLALRVAEEYARAGETDDAKAWVLKAIAAGWSSATYLRENETLAPLVETPPLSKVLERLSDAPIEVQGPVGFGGLRGWTGSGDWVRHDQGGMHYMLSCMLGVIHPLGSTQEQVIAVLERAAAADHTHPVARFGFAKTGDVRSKTRFPGFASAMVWLNKLGKETEIFSSALPRGNHKYSGLMLGSATLDLSGRTWTMVPGAIADSLTSHAANYEESNQTKLNELLHAGAALSCGTVSEPYSLQFKFPLPVMHAYYAEGVSAIEALYLGVTSPYQLLAVGDPLCQPFAAPPAELVRLQLAEGTGNRVEIKREALPLGLPSSPTKEIQIFFEGKLIRASPAVEGITMNLPEELSGATRVGVVLIGNDATEPRVRYSEVLELRGPHPIPVAVTKPAVEDPDALPPLTPVDPPPAVVELSCEGADRIDLMYGVDLLRSVPGGAGTVSIDRKVLGDGPLRLRPVAHFGAAKVPGRELLLAP